MAENRSAAGCCCSFIFTSGLTALFMWLSLRTYKPTCSIQHFYVPSLNQTLNTNTNTNSTLNRTIFFDLKLDNGMKDKGVHYDAINLTFFYNNNPSNSSTARVPIATYTVPPFYQGHGKKARRSAAVEAEGPPWTAGVGFRVGLATRVKYKIMFWYTKRESLVVGGDVEVGPGGEKVRRKGIKLKSGSGGPGLGRRWGLVMGVLTFLIILLL